MFPSTYDSPAFWTANQRSSGGKIAKQRPMASFGEGHGQAHDDHQVDSLQPRIKTFPYTGAEDGRLVTSTCEGVAMSDRIAQTIAPRMSTLQVKRCAFVRSSSGPPWVVMRAVVSTSSPATWERAAMTNSPESR